MQFSLRKIVPIGGILVLVTLTLYLVSCNGQNSRSKSVISINTHEANLGNVDIVTFNKLSVSEQIILGSFFSDSLRNNLIEIELLNPLFVTLKVENNWFPMYLEPGYSLGISISESSDSVEFSGNGSSVNNYLVHTKYISRKYTDLLSLNLADFQARYEEMQIELSEFHANYFDSVIIGEDLKMILMKRSDLISLSNKQAYAWNYGVQNKFNLPKELQLDSIIPQDQALLHLQLPEYLRIWHMHLYLNYIASPKPNSDSLVSKPVFVRNQIHNASYPDFIKEYLYAKNVDHWLGSMGNTKIVKDLYAEFTDQYPSSKYHAPIEGHLDKWLSISKGQPAPDFKSESIAGDSIALSQFIGNVVYIDVWATWCRPCIEEIPYSKILKNRFATSDSIKFLNVSVDRDKVAWKNFVNKDVKWSGIHVINDGSIGKSYLINGYPRYILVDKNGKIFDPDALRPSQGDTLYHQLNVLLNM